MEGYMSRLMRNYSATELVIVRDDATIAEHQRADFSTVAASTSSVPKRPSFSNSPTKNSAPTLPSRKKSIDDMSLTLMRNGGSRRKRSSLNDEMLSHGIKSIGSHPLPSLGEGSESSSRHMLFDHIFRDVDEMLKETSYE